jgi:hypothetical protein
VFVEIFERRGLGADLLGDAHGREIEEKDEQAFIVIRDFARLFGGDGGLRGLGEGELVGKRKSRRRLGVGGEF